jgi:hypothetical protein
MRGEDRVNDKGCSFDPRRPETARADAAAGKPSPSRAARSQRSDGHGRSSPVRHFAGVGRSRSRCRWPNPAGDPPLGLGRRLDPFQIGHDRAGILLREAEGPHRRPRAPTVPIHSQRQKAHAALLRVARHAGDARRADGPVRPLEPGGRHGNRSSQRERVSSPLSSRGVWHSKHIDTRSTMSDRISRMNTTAEPRLEDTASSRSSD